MLNLYHFILQMTVITVCIFLNVGVVFGRGGVPNSISATNGIPPQQIPSQNSNIIHQMAHLTLNGHNNNNSPLGGIASQQQSEHQKNYSKNKSHKKEGVNVGGKVKVQQKLKSGMKSKKITEKKEKKKGPLGMIMFFVFLLFSVIVPENIVPNNVMIQYNNKFVPIEQQFVSCQLVPNGIGQKCEFIVEQLAMSKELPNVTFWANLRGDDNAGTIQRLGQEDFRNCEMDNDGHSSYCNTELVISSADQIDQLQKLPIANVHKNTVIKMDETDLGLHGGRRMLLQNAGVCPPGMVKFNLINKCTKKLWIIAASREYPTANITLEASTQLSVCAQGVMSSGRIWTDTDCDQRQCSFGGAVPPVSLFEMTFNADGSQFMDVSYVDGLSQPIGVSIPNCKNGQPESISYDATLVANLTQNVPGVMIVDNSDSSNPKVKSVCVAYNTPQVCCQNEYAVSGNCGPNAPNNGWTSEQKHGYEAFRQAFPDSYAFAFDDKPATKICQSASEVSIGFCTNL